jgi:hypothetical protein
MGGPGSGRKKGGGTNKKSVYKYPKKGTYKDKSGGKRGMRLSTYFGSKR